jgi:iron complex outermembrane receptor protein
MKSLLAGSSLLALIAFASVAHAADAAAAAADASASADTGSTVSEVIVTGTRQTGVKAADSAAPIQVVGGEALKHVGQPDLIQTLSQVLPSFNAEGYGADTAALTLSAALRGLSPNDTLVLVNGKRRHTTSNLSVDAGSPYTGSAAADLSLIPVAAIDHVEVLQDGAAAQYGSDAIAGVINIILKSADHGGSINLSGGQYYDGDGDTGSWSINKGFSLGGRGFLNLTAEETYHDFSQRGSCDVRDFDPNTCAFVSQGTANAGAANAPGYPNVNKIYGDPQYNVYKFFLNTAYDLGGGVQFYGSASYAHRDSSAFENYRRPSRVVDANGTELFPNGFDPREAIKEDDYSFTAGLKGQVIGWNWDLSTTYGDDRDLVHTKDSANPGVALLNVGPTQTNFYDGSFEASEWTSNLDLSRDFALGLASPLNVAFGGEVRRNTFAIGAGETNSYILGGASSYPGFAPTDAGEHSRTNYSAYLDFAVDPIAGLHIDAAGRYEHYTDFGDTEIGKVTARYDFNPKIAIRGTISSGFRAPTLAEEYYSSTNVSPSFAFVQLPPNSPAAQLAGFQPLKPELSHSYSVGFVSHPLERLQVTVDLYDIIIRDRIINSGALIGSTCSPNNENGPCEPPSVYTVVSPGIQNALNARGGAALSTGLSSTGIQIFSNAANTRTRGIEAAANYSTDFGEYGHIDWSLGFNYTQTDVTALAPLPAQVTNVAAGQTVLLPPFALTGLTTAAPREKGIIGVYYTLGKWSVNLRDTIYGPSSEQVSPDQTGINGYLLSIGTTSITDLDFGYQINSSLKLDVGANNLFDQRPPGVPYVNGVGQVDGNNVRNEPYQFSPYGINGGYYYVKVNYTF